MLLTSSMASIQIINKAFSELERQIVNAGAAKRGWNLNVLSTYSLIKIADAIDSLGGLVSSGGSTGTGTGTGTTTTSTGLTNTELNTTLDLKLTNLNELTKLDSIYTKLGELTKLQTIDSQLLSIDSKLTNTGLIETKLNDLYNEQIKIDQVISDLNNVKTSLNSLSSSSAALELSAASIDNKTGKKQTRNTYYSTVNNTNNVFIDTLIPANKKLLALYVRNGTGATRYLQFFITPTVVANAVPVLNLEMASSTRTVFSDLFADGLALSQDGTQTIKLGWSTSASGYTASNTAKDIFLVYEV